jgi:arabinogalactan oligomer/maltooligosaccharide transport system permease protein
MVFFGGHYLSRLYILGEVESAVDADSGTIIYGENSFNILLYGVLTLFFIVAFIYTWNLNIKQNRISEQIIKDNKKLATAQDDLRAMVDKEFHKTLLAIPTIGILIFTVLPIFFMILVAFTNYDANHTPPLNLFGWVGFDNWGQLFTWENSEGTSFSMTFGQILLWTLIWAFFATFSNYFIGMLIAMLINKKGIKLKKLWRTVLVFSIAIPQFISLLFVSNMFKTDGIINGLFGTHIDFWGNAILARITVIVINLWIGVPYLMLVVTGILMNIPADLYESANIDGANPWQQYTKITLPYMLFITGPYLLTSFTGNMNNFNVIYLLTGGGPNVQEYYGNAGKTDLLITWLFSLAVNDSNYKLAAVIGIMVFVVVAVLSLVVYNIIPSTRNEEEFQ